MIAHQAIRLHLPLRLLTGLARRAKQPLPVPIIVEDRLPLVPPVDQVIHGPRMLNP
jgi:hypothetical protein